MTSLIKRKWLQQQKQQQTIVHCFSPKVSQDLRGERKIFKCVANGALAHCVCPLEWSNVLEFKRKSRECRNCKQRNLLLVSRNGYFFLLHSERASLAPLWLPNNDNNNWNDDDENN